MRQPTRGSGDGQNRLAEARAGERELVDTAIQANAAAQGAKSDAEAARTEAVRAENGAKEARAGAERAEDSAASAAQAATEAALDADALLLDEDAQKLAAQVSEAQPFGIPGRAVSRHSQVRAGFTVTVGVLLAVALGLTIRALEPELLILVTAAFIAVGLEPAVGWLTRHHLRRGLAVLVISLLSVGLAAAFLAAAVPPLVNEAAQLVSQGPQFFRQLQDDHTSIGHLNTQFHIEDKLASAANQKLTLNTFGGVLGVGQAIVSFTFEVVIILVLVLYILADFVSIKKAFYRLVPLSRRPRVALLGDEILARTGGYILGNLLTSLIAILCQYIILRALGVPYALVLSVFVGILDLIPLVGSTVAGVLVTLIALASVSITAAIINVAFTIVYRLAEDYLINPRVLKRTVEVRPLVTIVAVLLGGSLLGMIGALIAVPAAAALQLILTEVIYPRMDSAGASGQRTAKAE